MTNTSGNPKKNGHAGGSGQVLDATLEQAEQQVVQDWELAQETPIKPVKRFKYQKNPQNKSYAFYQSISWPEWWDEFNGKLRKNARWEYKTIWSFIKVKEKSEDKRQLLYEMIGPEPEIKEDREQLRVPYLGDWEKRRANGFWVFDDQNKVRSITEAIRTRAEQQESVRALAPMIAARLARWYKLAQLIDEGFGGQPYLEAEEVVSPKNKKRIREYMRLQSRVQQTIEALEKQWMRVHGMDPLQPAMNWVDMAALAGRVGAAGALTGAVAAQAAPGSMLLEMPDGNKMALPSGLTYDQILLAQHLKAHEKTFNLPLPEEMKKATEAKGKTQ